ncbi:MAG: protein kinase [Caldimonas sp.]
MAKPTSFDPVRWRQLSPLVDELLDLDAEARSARLDELGREDESLARDLRDVLAAHDQLQHGAFLEGTALVGDEMPTIGETLAGRTIGKYTLDRAIGQGGMSTVWLAHRSDGRYEGQVAIKLLDLALLVRTGTQRFEREGNLLARLAHPHIAHLIDAGVAEGSQPYLVIEYIEGESIDTWCDSHGLDVHARIRLFLDVLDAVAHAHHNLVLHRDLKPTNILVTPDGQVKLLDFGIATLLHDGDASVGASELTNASGRAFTPAYASPEQVQGQPLTTATDVYALGVLLYGLLGGQHPTGKDTLSPVMQLRAVVDTEPPRLSDALVRSPTIEGVASARASTPLQLARSLRGDLDNILAKALKKSPAERYATSTEFADDLRRYLDHQPVGAHADSLGYRLRKFVRRHRIELAFSAAVGAAVVAGVVATLWQAGVATRERATAVLERDRAERALKRSDAAREFTHALLTQVAQSPKPVTFQEILEHGEQFAAHQGSTDPAQQADVLMALAGFYTSVGDERKSLALTERASQLAARSGDPVLMASAGCAYGQAVASVGDLKRGAEIASQAQSQAGDDAQTQSDCWQQRSYIAMMARDGAGMLASSQAALAALDRVPHASPVNRAQLISDTASAYRLLGQTAQADAAYGRAIEMLTQMQKADSIEAAVIWSNWGMTADASGQDSLAAERYRHALTNEEQILGADAVAGATLNNLARKSVRLNRLDDADKYSERALKRFREVGTPAQIALALLAGSEARLAQGRFDEAKALLAQARTQIGAKAETAQSPAPSLLFQQAKLERAQGDAAAALRTIDTLTQRILAAGAPPEPKVSRYQRRRERAETLIALGRFDAALEDITDALARARELQGSAAASSYTGLALLTEARLDNARGDAAAARTHAAEALPNLQATLGPEHPETRAAAQLAGP